MKALAKAETRRTLDKLDLGESAVIRGLSSGNKELRNKLLCMGFVEGAAVEVCRVAPLGDPMNIKILGFQLSLRLTEAASVVVGS